MCGIIGYIGERAAGPILLEGLQRLEYRGYDSAGIAVMDRDGAVAVLKRSGKLAELVNGDLIPEGATGIGHTRWATHGAATDRNAHPHTSSNGDVVVVHNGIVENYRALRERLTADGAEFSSDTDAEVIPQLISWHLARSADFPTALRAALGEIEGGNALVLLHRAEPDRLYAARLGSAGGIVLGFGEDEMFLASDLPALLPHTARVRYLEDGEIATVMRAGLRISDAEGRPVEATAKAVGLDPVAVAKGPYKHFMLKEIMEQPRALSDTIRGRAHLDPASVSLEDIPFADEDLARLQRVLVIGMGTSLHACMIGRSYMEQLGGVAADFDNAAEFRYREPLLGPETLVISVSQSGETVDTLGAMAHVREHWQAPQITICNVVGAESTRLAEGTFYVRCTPEIGVASSKTFVASIAALYLLACRIGHARGHLDDAALADALEALLTAPSLVDRSLEMADGACVGFAERFRELEDLLVLGRGLEYPVAMEAALKCKELSYIHAEGYAAGEMKHGPIALIDARFPALALMPRNALYPKMWSNVLQVQARGGPLIAIGEEADTDLAALADHFIPVPAAPALLTPFTLTPAAQLLAYHLAAERGLDIDQPRNLAKTVTVE